MTSNLPPDLPANAEERRQLVFEFVRLRERIRRAGMHITANLMQEANDRIGFESIGDIEGGIAYAAKKKARTK